MRKRRPLLEAGSLLTGAALCSAISNAVAGPERRLRWVGEYAEVAGLLPAGSGVLALTPVPRSAAPSLPAGEPAIAPATSAPASAKASVSAVASAKAEKTFVPHPEKAWVEISGEDAAQLFSRRTVPFLDARRTSVYRDGHIAGARPFAVWEADVDEKVKKLYEEGLDQNAPIVVYCSGGDCEDSHMLSQKLYMVGFNNMLVYKGGYPDWEKRGLPISKGNTR